MRYLQCSNESSASTEAVTRHPFLPGGLLLLGLLLGLGSAGCSLFETEEETPYNTVKFVVSEAAYNTHGGGGPNNPTMRWDFQHKVTVPNLTDETPIAVYFETSDTFQKLPFQRETGTETLIIDSEIEPEELVFSGYLSARGVSDPNADEGKRELTFRVYLRDEVPDDPDGMIPKENEE